jgi:uncharacterized protein
VKFVHTLQRGPSSAKRPQYAEGVLAYVATKGRFLQDAPEIEDIVQREVERGLGLHVSTGSAEYVSWQNSLGRSLFHVLNTSTIPDNAGVAIEYRVVGAKQRIDVLLSGLDSSGTASVVLIELKQWSTVDESALEDHVVTYVGGGRRDVIHPSYQAWSYASLLQSFYEVVTADPICIQPCAYVHNCSDESVLRSEGSATLREVAPLFLKGDVQPLRNLIRECVAVGDGARALRRLDESALAPSRALVDALASMLEGNREFVLIDDQKQAFELIMNMVRESGVGDRQVLVVTGGPGTGKSVIAVNALVRLLREGLNARYVSKNAAPRHVYSKRLRGNGSRVEVNNLFVAPDVFLRADPEAFDVLLVDEAHRLTRQSGPFRNLGENQVAEITRASRVSVFFLDEAQRVTWRDIGTRDEIARVATSVGATVREVALSAQFRCAGSNEYLRWVDDVLSGRPPAPGALADATYDVQVFDSPSYLRDVVTTRNDEGGTSRLLAGYCWPWVSKNNVSAYDITFPNFDVALRWNLSRDGLGWLSVPSSINEVGCIHTIQGLEGDYMGVIIGPDFLVRDGIVFTDPSARASTDQSVRGWRQSMKTDPEGTRRRTDEIIRNTYRTLLTRGMRGTYLYSTDEETNAYLAAMVALARAGDR